MRLPVVAIVGRPNVGKSSLFNMLAGRRISIVDPTAGVTRDRVTYPLEVGQYFCELVDTGGVGIVDHDDLTTDVERQIQYAIEEAAMVLFVVDIRAGVTPLDETVADKLRAANKPIIFVANKADEEKLDIGIGDLFRLGYGTPILVSANSKRGRDELLFEINERLPHGTPTAAPANPELKIAIVGRRNVGKSTFINSLAQAERVIVSEVAGTTRDSVDVRFERDGKVFVAIDTAGVRKRKSLASDIEFYSLHRAERSIRRADVVLHFFDPRLRISRVDKKLTEYILEQHKPAIFVVNKWDLAKQSIPTEKWSEYLRKVFAMLDYVPIAFITAKQGKNVYRLLNLAQELHKQSAKRVRTGALNRVIRDALLANNPPVRNNKVPKVYYAAQVAVHPPTVILVTNAPELFDRTYLRYLLKCIRDSFQFGEVPIRLILKTKGEAASYSDRKAFIAAEIAALEAQGQTDEYPSLADEPIGDLLRDQSPDDDEDDDDDTEHPTFDDDGYLAGPAGADAKPKPPTQPKTNDAAFGPKPKKKRKRGPDTWDV
jgi:GTP-binding protein